MMTFTSPQQRSLLDYARGVIRARLTGTSAPAALDDPAFRLQAGCFVTLHSLDGHRLRGCIGRLTAEAPLIETLREMAEASLEDSRFAGNPVTAAEFPELELEITVLSPLEPARDLLDFDLLQHGLYLQCDGRGGCFLPQVARETLWDKPTLLGHLCADKMGLRPTAWRSPAARLFRFTTTIVGPEPFES
jgi:AmmeMemoRadiSam system protein A